MLFCPTSPVCAWLMQQAASGCLVQRALPPVAPGRLSLRPSGGAGSGGVDAHTWERLWRADNDSAHWKGLLWQGALP